MQRGGEHPGFVRSPSSCWNSVGEKGSWSEEWNFLGRRHPASGVMDWNGAGAQSSRLKRERGKQGDCCSSHCAARQLLGAGQYKTVSEIDTPNLVNLYSNPSIPRALQDTRYCCRAADGNTNMGLKIWTDWCPNYLISSSDPWSFHFSLFSGALWWWQTEEWWKPAVSYWLQLCMKTLIKLFPNPTC